MPPVESRGEKGGRHGGRGCREACGRLGAGGCCVPGDRSRGDGEGCRGEGRRGVRSHRDACGCHGVGP